MIRFERQVRWFSGQLDVAAFACVFFLLVIFLVLLTHLAPVPGVRIDLPEAALTEPPSGVDWLVVVADKEGRLFFNQQVISEADLAGALADALAARTTGGTSNVELVLQADTEVSLGQLARFYALSRQAGLTRLKLQTRPSRPLVPPAQASP